jgi:hypothetical protein
VPDPVLTLLTRNSVKFLQFFLQNFSIGLCTGGKGRGWCEQVQSIPIHFVLLGEGGGWSLHVYIKLIV